MHLGALKTKDLDASVGVCACLAFLNRTLTFHYVCVCVWSYFFKCHLDFQEFHTSSDLFILSTHKCPGFPGFL